MAGDFPALGFDPAPGELGAVDRLQARLSRVSTVLSETRTTLSGITRSGGIWEGDAAQAFYGTVGELTPYLDAAVSSMTSAGNALRGWHADLAVMQRTARQLEAEAAQAKRELERAQSNPALPALGGLDPTLLVDEEAQRAQAALDQAEQKYEQIKERAERLKDEHEDLAERTAEKIKAAKDEAPEEPGLFDRAGDLFAGLLRSTPFGIGLLEWEFTQNNPNVVANLSDVAATTSSLLGPIGIVAPPVGGVAAGLSGLAAIGHTGAYIAGAEDVTPETIEGDVVGVFTFGVGRLARDSFVEILADGSGTAGGAPGTIDNLQEYYVPRNDAQAVASGVPFIGPGGIAAWNAFSDGRAEDAAAE